MGFTCGIIGFPNVGKSTIFNALAGAGAEMANYPFCTIEPNRGIVPVPDERLYKIAVLLQKKDPIQTRIEFIDVAGLVEGASRGEGLGNKFLGHIREVDAVVHVVRCFKSGDVAHVTGGIDPIRDVETVNTELMISDMEILERARDKQNRLAKSGDREAAERLDTIIRCIDHLNSGRMLAELDLHENEIHVLKEYGLITCKPVLYCSNTDEGEKTGNLAAELAEYARKNNAGFVTISGKLEEEISELPADEKEEFLKGMGLDSSGLERLIKASYTLLDLITFYTTATQMQAWTLLRGTDALHAAGKIHTDFEKGFIRAEVFTCDDLFETGSEHTVRAQGKLRSEGKEYIVQDGDIIRFLFNR